MSEKTIKTIKGTMFGECQALISKAGNPYLKGTIITEEDGVRIFVNACFFPSQEDLQKMRALLCKGRIVEAKGAYSEREYTGRDGTPKVAHDILVHDIKIGAIEEWNGEKKSTQFGLMEGVTEKDLKPQAVLPKATKPAGETTKMNISKEDEDFLDGIKL